MKPSLKKSADKLVAAKKPVKAVRTTIAKKTAPKATTKKKIESNLLSVRKKKISEKKALEKPEVVTLPSMASVRLLEKVELYRLWYQNSLSSYMANTARVGGYAFIVLGTIFSSYSYVIDKNYSQLSAAVVCSDQNACIEVNDADLPPGSPLVTFLNSLPATFENDMDIVVKAENSPQLKVYLVNSISGNIITLDPLEESSTDEHRYLIQAKNLASSMYTMSAEVKVANTIYKFTGPKFTISQNEADKVDLVDKTTEKILQSEEVSTSTIEGVLSVSTTTEETIETLSVDNEGIDNPKVNSLSLNLKETNDSKYLSVKTGSLLPSRVEIYAQVPSFDAEIFLGLATLVQGEWIFSLSALDLPDITMMLHSSFAVEGVVYQTEGVLYNPADSEVSMVGEEGLDEVILKQKIDLALESASLDPQTRSYYFSTYSSSTQKLFDLGYEEQYASPGILSMTNEVMKEASAEIDSLLKLYATAVQVGNSYLINLADSKLIQQYKSLSVIIADAEEEKAIIPTLNTVFAHRYNLLKDLILENENKISEVTSNLTSRDTDSDGIADFDEVTFFETSPTNADSDNDGVIDSIEIFTSFDPKTSDVIKFLDKEQSYEDMIFDEAIKITSVEPLIIKDGDTGEENVFALIQGKSIPNAFISLFSTDPAFVGIIRTNSDGNFSYTLEKVVTDGRHEIVAVLSDNVGNIITSSKPYHFTKTSNEFLAAAAANGQAFFEQEVDNDQLAMSTIVAAVSVVTFGFILLLLSQNLRARNSIVPVKA